MTHLAVGSSFVSCSVGLNFPKILKRFFALFLVLGILVYFLNSAIVLAVESKPPLVCAIEAQAQIQFCEDCSCIKSWLKYIKGQGSAPRLIHPEDYDFEEVEWPSGRVLTFDEQDRIIDHLMSEIGRLHMTFKCGVRSEIEQTRRFLRASLIVGRDLQI